MEEQHGNMAEGGPDYIEMISYSAMDGHHGNMSEEYPGNIRRNSILAMEAQEGNVADEGPAHLEMISYSAMDAQHGNMSEEYPENIRRNSILAMKAQEGDMAEEGPPNLEMNSYSAMNAHHGNMLEEYPGNIRRDSILAMETQERNMAEKGPANLEMISHSAMPFGNRTLSTEMDSFTKEFEHSQIKLAGRLQAAHLKKKNLKLFDKVNSHTCQARELHEYLVSLMKKFLVTSTGIANTMIPMAIEAVEMEENESILALFPLAIAWARDMETETRDTKKMHAEIIHNQRDSIDIEKCERERNEDFRRNLNHEIIMLNEKKDEVQKKRLKLENNLRDSKKNAAHLGARGYFYYNIISVEVGQGMEQNEIDPSASQLEYDELGNRLEFIEESIKTKTDCSCSMESQMTNQLAVEKCLEEALHYLEKTSKILNNLIIFWKDIAEQLSHMITRQENDLTPLESSLEEQGAESFMHHWYKYKEDWDNVTDTLRHYIGNCESNAEDSINGLYSFTSEDENAPEGVQSPSPAL